MKTSPFPGMDPYLERRWGDVHIGLLAGISAALQPHLPSDLQSLCQEGRTPPAPDVRTDRWVEIIDLDDGDRVVTAIEVLSPSNKAGGEGSRAYRRKLLEYVRAGVNIVEIDLLRSSRERLLVPAVGDDRGRPADYYTCVNWAADPARWEAYPMPLRDVLPTVPVPCRSGEADVPLPLQAVIDRVYVEGGHGRTRYARPLDRPLSAADAAWAAERVAAWAR